MSHPVCAAGRHRHIFRKRVKNVGSPSNGNLVATPESLTGRIEAGRQGRRAESHMVRCLPVWSGGCTRAVNPGTRPAGVTLAEKRYELLRNSPGCAIYPPATRPHLSRFRLRGPAAIPLLARGLDGRRPDSEPSGGRRPREAAHLAGRSALEHRRPADCPNRQIPG